MRNKKRVLGCISALAILLGSIPMDMMNVEAEDTVETTYYDVATTENLKLHGVTYDTEDGIYRRMDLDRAASIAKILRTEENPNGVEKRQDYDFVKYSTDEDTGEITYSFTNNVYSHAREAAGGRIRFSTNSANVSVKATLKNHFAEYAESMVDGKYGFDVYVDTAEGSTYAGTISVETVPTQEDPEVAVDVNVEGTITFDDATERNLTVYFPITIEVTSVAIGVDAGSTLGTHNVSYVEDEKILFYGSSITQGGAATKPGNTYVNIVGRNLNTDYLNLGMWGSCKGQAEFAQYIAGLKDTEGFTAFVFDYDHNNKSKDYLEETHFAFYEIVREAYPDIPIIMISRPNNRLDEQHAGKPDEFSTIEEMKAVVYDSYVKACLNGDENVHFIDGESFFGYAKGYLADGVHPNDAGQAKMAETVTAVLEQVYAGEKNLCVRPSDCEQLLLSEDFEDAVSGEAPDGWSHAENSSSEDVFQIIEEESGNAVYQISYDKGTEKPTAYFGTSNSQLSGLNGFATETDVTLYKNDDGYWPTLNFRIGGEDPKTNRYEVRLVPNEVGYIIRLYDYTNGSQTGLTSKKIEDTYMAEKYGTGVFPCRLRVESELVTTGSGETQIVLSVYVNENYALSTAFYPTKTDFSLGNIRFYVVYGDEGVQRLTLDDIQIFDMSHNLTMQNEIPATIKAEGTKAHYVCGHCQKKYLDATGLIEVMDKDLVIPQIVSCMILDEKFDNGKNWTANASNTADGKDGFKIITEGDESKYQLAYTRTTEATPSGYIKYKSSQIFAGLTKYTAEIDTTLYKAENDEWSYVGFRMRADNAERFEIRVKPSDDGANIQLYNGSTLVKSASVEDDNLAKKETVSAISYHLRVDVDIYTNADGENRVCFVIYLNEHQLEGFDVVPTNASWQPTDLYIYLFAEKVTEDTLYKAAIDNLQIYTLTHPTETMSTTAAVTSTWDATGAKEYHTCGVCGNEFLDAEATILRTNANKNFAALKDIKCQTRVNDNGLTDLRFVAYVDDFSQYPKIEFVVKSETAAGVVTLDRTMICESVYYGVVADDQFVNTGDIYGQAGTFAAIKIMNNTEAHLQENMTITVKWYDANDTVVKETSRNICVATEQPQ